MMRAESGEQLQPPLHLRLPEREHHGQGPLLDGGPDHRRQVLCQRHRLLRHDAGAAEDPKKLGQVRGDLPAVLS